MKRLLLIVSLLIVNSCSNPASPELPVQISAKLNGTPLELCGWANSENKQLEVFVYDSVQNVRTIIDDYQVGLHKAFVQYQKGCEVFTADRADVLVTGIENDLLSCGISFLVIVNEEKIEGTIKINNLRIMR